MPNVNQYSHLSYTTQPVDTMPEVTSKFDAFPYRHRTQVVFVRVAGKVHGLFSTGDLVEGFPYCDGYAVGTAGSGW